MDVASEAISYAKNNLHLNVINNSYLKERFGRKFDAICMWDTIEHLQYPERFIEKSNQDLKMNGYLFLTTGDIASLLAKIQGKKWRMIHPPTHLFYFSKETIIKLLEKYGFKVVSITYPGIYRNLRQIIYSIFFLNKKQNTELVHKIINWLNIPVYLNTFDIMFVIAKRIR